MRHSKYLNLYLIIVIISMAVSPAFALGTGNRNLFLIGVMYLSPLVILFSGRLYRKDILILAFCASLIFSPLIFHPESIRWSTMLYSIMFCLTFMAYYHILNHGTFTIQSYYKIIKYLIYAYFITLLIQQLCIIFGLPIFNLSNYNADEPWKLNSLAAEPSHSARIMGLLMYCYISIKETIYGKSYEFGLNFKEDKWIWLAFLWTMLTMGSGTAFLFIPIILIKFLKIRNILPLIGIMIGIFLIINILNITSIERTRNVFLATLSLDEDKIMAADHSAAVRIIPVIVCIKMFELGTINGLFGHGVDFVSSFMYEKVGAAQGSAAGGGLFALDLDFGFIPFILFIILSISMSISKKNLHSYIFWILLILLNSLNMQIIWITMILLYTNKYFLKAPIATR